MAKAKGERAEIYKKPFIIKGKFEDVIKVAVRKKPLEKKEENKS